MQAYLKQHEALIRGALQQPRADLDWPRLAEQHRRRIAWMQHERLIHLLVTLFFGLAALLVGLAVAFLPRPELGLLLFLILALLVPYVVHYFRLENGVQRLYALADEIERRAGLDAPRNPAGPGAGGSGG